MKYLCQKIITDSSGCLKFKQHDTLRKSTPLWRVWQILDNHVEISGQGGGAMGLLPRRGELLNIFWIIDVGKNLRRIKRKVGNFPKAGV